MAAYEQKGARPQCLIRGTVADVTVTRVRCHAAVLGLAGLPCPAHACTAATARAHAVSSETACGGIASACRTRLADAAAAAAVASVVERPAGQALRVDGAGIGRQADVVARRVSAAPLLEEPRNGRTPALLLQRPVAADQLELPLVRCTAP